MARWVGWHGGRVEESPLAAGEALLLGFPGSPSPLGWAGSALPPGKSIRNAKVSMCWSEPCSFTQQPSCFQEFTLY